MVTTLLASPHFLLSVILFSFLVKIYLLITLLPHGTKNTSAQKPLFFLFGILIGSMAGNVAWIVKLTREIFFPLSSYNTVVFFIRIAWAFLVLKYQSLSLFIQSLTVRYFTLSRFHLFLLLLGVPFSLYFVYLAFFDSHLINEAMRESVKQNAKPPLEISMMRYVVVYLFYALILPSLYFTCHRINKKPLPKILKKQLKTFLKFLIVPYIIVELLQSSHFLFNQINVYLYPLASISTLLLTYALFYCIRSVMGLRFLNRSNHVSASHLNSNIKNFKYALEHLSNATTFQELGHITQEFFRQSFAIPLRQVSLYIRPERQKENITNTQPIDLIKIAVENYFAKHDPIICSFIKNNKIIIYDEITFTHFYNETQISCSLLSFMQTISADIFLPIFNNKKIIAYIIIDKDTRHNSFYTNIERDEMIMYATYLSNIIHVIRCKNINNVRRNERQLKNELYSLNKILSLSKESTQFLYNLKKIKSPGILFYKNKQFTYANQTAKNYIPFNINLEQGHRLYKTLKNIVTLVESYKTTQETLTYSCTGNLVNIIAFPHLEKNCVIILITTPSLNNLLSNHTTPYMSDDIMFLVYLKTTQIGMHIEQLIPSSSQLLLTFKIKLFKQIIQRNIIFLDAHEDDIMPLVELIHTSRNGKLLHTFSINSQHNAIDDAIQLFGINTLFAEKNKYGIPLFKKLADNGTLFIKNIHYLDAAIQTQLVEYLHYGVYKKFKSDEKIKSNLCILCTDTYNLQKLEKENKINAQLLCKLKQNNLILPRLSQLPQEELYELIDNICNTIIKNNRFNTIFTLSPNDKQNILRKYPQSIAQLKELIHEVLQSKLKKNKLSMDNDEKKIDILLDSSLIEAQYLGKQALKNKKIMQLLWQHFKNQNKIASFLHVHRSSVSRRCKEYNLD